MHFASSKVYANEQCCMTMLPWHADFARRQNQCNCAQKKNKRYSVISEATQQCDEFK